MIYISQLLKPIQIFSLLDQFELLLKIAWLINVWYANRKSYLASEFVQIGPIVK